MVKLNVSEVFYSVQGEGVTQGKPALFIRLQDCNLICGGANANLVKSGKATWWCDTEKVWRSGEPLDYYELENEIANELFSYSLNIKDHLIKNDFRGARVNIVWTGGEPMMQQGPIMRWLDMFKKQYRHMPYNEIETNGTILGIGGFFQKYIHQINCSPKLENSGMPEKIRIIPEVIKQIDAYPNSWFKFVISTEDDIHEIEETYIEPFGIDKNKVILMPGVDKLEDLSERTRFMYEMSKKHGYIGITRGHILAWNQTTGV